MSWSSVVLVANSLSFLILLIRAPSLFLGVANVHFV